MTYVLSIEIKGLPKITSNGSQGSWKTKWTNAKKWQQLTMFAVGNKAPRVPLEKAHVTFTRVSSVEPDFDNLVISFKACADGLVKAGVLIDDKASNIVAKYDWVKGKQKQGHIKIQVVNV